MMNTLRLYGKYFSIHLRSAMQYKASFFLTILGQFLSAFTMFLSVYFMFTRFHQVEGFTYSQVLLCFAVVVTAFSLSECFARGFDAFSSMISNGEFDRVMVRPRNEMFQVLASKMEFSRVGRLVQCLMVLAYAIPTSGVEWDLLKAITLVLMIVGGVVTFSGIFVIYAALCFFTTEGLEFMNIITDGAREYGKYPFVIYGKKVLTFLTFIVPLALFQYYPFLFLLGRETSLWYMFLPLVGCLFVIPCYLVWRVGMKHYKSTGS